MEKFFEENKDRFKKELGEPIQKNPEIEQEAEEPTQQELPITDPDKNLEAETEEHQEANNPNIDKEQTESLNPNSTELLGLSEVEDTGAQKPLEEQTKQQPLVQEPETVLSAVDENTVLNNQPEVAQEKSLTEIQEDVSDQVLNLPQGSVPDQILEAHLSIDPPVQPQESVSQQAVEQTDIQAEELLAGANNSQANNSSDSVRTERVVPEDEELQNLPEPPRIPEAVVIEVAERNENHSTKTQSKKREVSDEGSSEILSTDERVVETPQDQNPRADQLEIQSLSQPTENDGLSQKTRDKRPESVKTMSKKVENIESNINLASHSGLDDCSEIRENSIAEKLNQSNKPSTVSGKNQQPSHDVVGT